MHHAHQNRYTIIDEADEMVGTDWVDDMRKIMSGGGMFQIQAWCLLLADSMPDNNEDADHLYMMFSATFPKDARTVAKEYMATDHVRIRVGRTGSTHLNVEQHVS